MVPCTNVCHNINTNNDHYPLALCLACFLFILYGALWGGRAPPGNLPISVGGPRGISTSLENHRCRRHPSPSPAIAVCPSLLLPHSHYGARAFAPKESRRFTAPGVRGPTHLGCCRRWPVAGRALRHASQLPLSSAGPSGAINEKIQKKTQFLSFPLD